MFATLKWIFCNLYILLKDQIFELIRSWYGNIALQWLTFMESKN
jgi:hypothetical protein